MIGRKSGDFFFLVTCHLSLVTLVCYWTCGTTDTVSRNL